MRRRVLPREIGNRQDARRARGDDLVILDSQPMREYRAMNVPGAIDCQGAELVYPARDAAPFPVLLTCSRVAVGPRSPIG